MIDLNKPLETRDGKKVRMLCTDAKGKYPVVGLIHYPNEDRARTWTKEGKFSFNGERKNDLVNVSEKITKWINIYPCRMFTSYDSKEKADNVANNWGRIACIKIEFKKGEGLWK